MIMAYDPRKPYLSGEQYVHNPNYLSPELAERVKKDVRTLCEALGYDLNTVEFAIKEGVPYAIDFMNPAPDAELASVGPFYHDWIVNAVTELVFKKLAQPRVQPRYRWEALLNPEPIRTSAVASKAEQQARTVQPAVVTPFEGAKAKTATANATEPSARGVRRAKPDSETPPRRSTRTAPQSTRPKKTT
jgi:hypothetical protein